MNTRVPSEPIFPLTHEFEKIIHSLMDEEDLSKKLKESVNLKGIIFPHPILH